MEYKRFEMRLFVLLFGMLCMNTAKAQISEEQEYFYEDSNAVDTNRVYEIAYQIIKDKSDRLKSTDKELKSMLTLNGKNVQNENQRKLLDRVFKSYVANRQNAPSTEYQETSSSSSKLAAIVIGSVLTSLTSGESKVERDAKNGIINKKLNSEIKLYDDSVLEYIQKIDTKLSNIKNYSISQLSFIGNFPMKKIKVLKENPYYRPNLIYNNSLLDVLDKKQQTVGWEWINEEKGVYKSQSYPYNLEYNYYESHPQYLTLSNMGEEKHDCIYNSNGTLVRINYFLREQVDRSIKDQIILKMCIQDFYNNKYNINKEGKSVNLAVKYHFGLLKSPTTKAQRLLGSAAVNNFKASMTGNYAYAYKAKRDLLRAFMSANISPAETKASDYASQLESDHKNDLNNLYKIERIDDTSFKLTFLNDNGVNNCTVKIRFFNKNRFNSDYKLDFLPNDTKQINMPKNPNE